MQSKEKEENNKDFSRDKWNKVYTNNRIPKNQKLILSSSKKLTIGKPSATHTHTEKPSIFTY